jgi:hypothetical protein
VAQPGRALAADAGAAGDAAVTKTSSSESEHLVLAAETERLLNRSFEFWDDFLLLRDKNRYNSAIVTAVHAIEELGRAVLHECAISEADLKNIGIKSQKFHRVRHFSGLFLAPCKRISTMPTIEIDLLKQQMQEVEHIKTKSRVNQFGEEVFAFKPSQEIIPLIGFLTPDSSDFMQARWLSSAHGFIENHRLGALYGDNSFYFLYRINYSRRSFGTKNFPARQYTLIYSQICSELPTFALASQCWDVVKELMVPALKCFRNVINENTFARN